MFNPLVHGLTDLSDAEVEKQIIDLGRKYWMTRNPDLQHQIAVILDMYKEEAAARRARAYQKSQQNSDGDLDNLININ